MELKDFVKKVIMDLDQAVTEANNETARQVRFKGVKDQKNSLEFDVAVTAESTKSGEGGGGIKVWNIVEAGGKVSNEIRNSTVSRVSFSVDISETTKEEDRRLNESIRNQFNNHNNPNDF
jgi:hypothetical protein